MVADSFSCVSAVYPTMSVNIIAASLRSPSGNPLPLAQIRRPDDKTVCWVLNGPDGNPTLMISE